MRYSIVYSVTEKTNVHEILKWFLSSFRMEESAYELVFLAKKAQEETLTKLIEGYYPIPARILIFEDSDQENNMFETALLRLHGTHAILVRSSYQSASFPAITTFIEAHMRGNAIVVSKQERNNNILIRYMRKISSLFMKFIYGFEAYEGEADIILLDRVAIDIIKSTPGRSALLTRLNNWQGINIASVEIDNQPKPEERRKPKMHDMRGMILCSVLLAALIITQVILAFVSPISWFYNLVFIAGELAVAFMLFFYLFKMLFYLQYGEIRYVYSGIIIKEVNNVIE